MFGDVQVLFELQEDVDGVAEVWGMGGVGTELLQNKRSNSSLLHSVNHWHE